MGWISSIEYGHRWDVIIEAVISNIVDPCLKPRFDPCKDTMSAESRAQLPFGADT